MITPADVALSQVGVAEATGNNDGVPSLRYQENPWWRPGDDEKLRYRQDPWCGMFAMWCYRASDWGPFERRQKFWWLFAGVDNLWNSGVAWGWRVPLPVPGDILVLNRRGRSDLGSGGHCAIVVDVDLEPGARNGGFVTTVDGNWENTVARVTRTVDLAEIVGYLRPYPAV